MSQDARHQIADTVHKPDRHSGVSHFDLYRFLRNELGFCRSDGPAVSALWQQVDDPASHIGVFNAGNHKQLHKPLDKCRLACSDGAYDAYMDLSARPFRYILINRSIRHTFVLFLT